MSTPTHAPTQPPATKAKAQDGFVFLKTALQVQVDQLVEALGKLPPADMPLVHRFTPGLYVREIFMPKGALVISEIHKTEHPFVVSKGHAAVWIEGKGIEHIKAPYCGITKPGTRRILFIHEDCVWTTFHPTDKTDPDEIKAEIIYDQKREPSIEVAGAVLQLTQEI